MTIETYWPPTHKHDRQKCIIMEKTAQKILKIENQIPGRKVGIEIEIENAYGTSTASIWGIMRTEKDGSLKDNGLELISYPLYESSINLFLQSVKNYYNDYPNTYFSHRCSIHLHINVGDLEREQVKLLLLTYLCLEPLFFDMSDPVREHNPFCVPLTDCTLSLSDMLLKEYLQNDQLKYFALNPCPILKYNSIEFRHLSGTKNIKKLKDWIVFCRTFVSYFKDCDQVNHKELMLRLKSDSSFRNLISNIFRGIDVCDYSVSKLIRSTMLAKGKL